MKMLVMVDHACNSAAEEEETSGSWEISGHKPSLLGELKAGDRLCPLKCGMQLLNTKS